MSRRGIGIAAGVALALLALVLGAALRYWSGDREQGVAELHRLVLPDPQGKPQPFSQWQGKVLVVNFWATWCDPCREEVPALVRIQQKEGGRGLQIVGIGIDSADKIREFAAKFHINYPLAVAGLSAVDTSRKLGNAAGGLPFTVILDRNGRLAATHLGGLTESQLDELLQPLLAS